MKKIIKTSLIVILVAVIGAFSFRAFVISTDKGTFDEFFVTDTSREAYKDGESLTVDKMKHKDKMGGNGYFCAYSLYYVEETGELQITVRYNKSALEYTKSKSHEDVEFGLLIRETPEDLSFVDGKQVEHTVFDLYDGEYLLPDYTETKTKYGGLYTYKKLIFNNVKLTGESFTGEDLVILMMKAGTEYPSPEDDPRTRQDAYETIFDAQVIHYCDQPFDSYKLSRGDIKSLKTEK